MPYEIYLVHHGIKGQSWGVRNGPPYPLGSGRSEKRKIKKAERIVSRLNEQKRTAEAEKNIANTPKLKRRALRHLKQERNMGYGLAASGALINGSLVLASPLIGPLASGGAAFAATAMTKVGFLKSSKASKSIKRLNKPDLIDDDLDRKIEQGEKHLARLGFELKERTVDKPGASIEYRVKKSK